MWLIKKKNSPYLFAQWRDFRTGKLQSASTKTSDRRLATERGKSLERERTAAPSLPTQTLHEALKALVAHKRRMKRSAATHEITETKCGHLLRLLGRGTDIAAIELTTTEAYLDTRRAEGVADSTIDKEVSQLMQALRIARRHKLYHCDPKDILPEALADVVYSPCTGYWTIEQYRAGQAHMIASRRDHVTVYCHTGCRFSELYRIKAEHIDRIGQRVFIDGTKTVSSKRWVNISAEAMRVLVRRAERYPSGPLFPDRWSKSRMKNDMRRVAKRAGVPPVTANDLRRTFATWCGDAGVDEGTCYKWMGHTSSKMIRLVYQQLSERRARTEAAKFDAFTRAPAPILTAASGSNGGSKPRPNRALSVTLDGVKTRRNQGFLR